MQADANDRPSAQKTQPLTSDEREVVMAEVAERIGELIHALDDFRATIIGDGVEELAFNTAYARLLKLTGESWLTPTGGAVLKAVVCERPVQPVSEFMRELATSVKE